MASYRNIKPPTGALLDRAHPLARDLIMFAPMLEGGGNQIIDVTGHYKGTLVTGGTPAPASPKWQTSEWTQTGTPPGIQFGQEPRTGRTLALPGVFSTGDYVDFGTRLAAAVSGVAQLTLSLRVRPSPNPSTQAYMGGYSGGGQIQLGFESNYYYAVASSSAYVGRGTASKWRSMTMVFDGTKIGNARLRFWLDRYEISGSALSGYNGAMPAVTDTISAGSFILGTNQTNGATGGGLFDYAAVWLRPLRPQEVQAFEFEPFALFRRPVRRLAYAAGAPPPPPPPPPYVLVGMAKPAILWALMGPTLVIGGGTTGTISVTSGASTQVLTFPATGTLGPATPYYMAGDGLANDLVTMLQASLNTFSGGPTFTVTQDGAGHLTITASGATQFAINPASTVDLTVYGLDNVATWTSTLGVLTIAANAKGGWFPGWMQEVDSLDTLPFIGGTSKTVAGVTRTVRIATTRKERDLGWKALDGGVVRDALAPVGGLYGTYERAWEESIGYGYPFRFYPDTLNRTATTYSVYELREDPKGWPWTRRDDAILFWDVDLLASRVS